MRVMALFFNFIFFAKCLHVGEDGPGRGHLCHIDTFLLTPLTFLFLSKTIKCWYAFSKNVSNILVASYFDLPKLFVFVSPVLHRCRVVHVLFGDISYIIRSAHWHVNNKIKRKFILFQ